MSSHEKNIKTQNQLLRCVRAYVLALCREKGGGRRGWDRGEDANFHTGTQTQTQTLTKREGGAGGGEEDRERDKQRTRERQRERSHTIRTKSPVCETLSFLLAVLIDSKSDFRMINPIIRIFNSRIRIFHLRIGIHELQFRIFNLRNHLTYFRNRNFLKGSDCMCL